MVGLDGFADCCDDCALMGFDSFTIGIGFTAGTFAHGFTGGMLAGSGTVVVFCTCELLVLALALTSDL